MDSNDYLGDELMHNTAPQRLKLDSKPTLAKPNKLKAFFISQLDCRDISIYVHLVKWGHSQSQGGIFYTFPHYNLLVFAGLLYNLHLFQFIKA